LLGTCIVQFFPPDATVIEAAGDALQSTLTIIPFRNIATNTWEDYFSLQPPANKLSIKEEACSVRWQILDGKGKVVATAGAASQQVAADGSAAFQSTARLTNPALWSPETPNLYSAIVSVESNGKIRDAERVSFGVRTIT